MEKTVSLTVAFERRHLLEIDITAEASVEGGDTDDGGYVFPAYVDCIENIRVVRQSLVGYYSSNLERWLYNRPDWTAYLERVIEARLQRGEFDDDIMEDVGRQTYTLEDALADRADAMRDDL